MFECEAPYDVATELFAVVETVRDEMLNRAVDLLERASVVEQATLEKRFAELLEHLGQLPSPAP